jgi:hypothetical protein
MKDAKIMWMFDDKRVCYSDELFEIDRAEYLAKSMTDLTGITHVAYRTITETKQETDNG